MKGKVKHLLSVISPTRRSLAFTGALWCAFWCLHQPLTYAQGIAQYPDKPVRIIVPFSPGGAADTFACLAGQKLSETWGNKQVIIENRAGAGGIIGTEATAKAVPDGYTFLMVTIGHAVNPCMYSKLPYDTRADLTPVALIATVPSLAVTGPGSSYKALRELLAAAKVKANDIQGCL